MRGRFGERQDGEHGQRRQRRGGDPVGLGRLVGVPRCGSSAHERGGKCQLQASVHE